MNWSQVSKRIKRLVEYHISTRQGTQYILKLLCHICCRYTEYESNWKW